MMCSEERNIAAHTGQDILMKKRSPHVCPNCGERVSAFAAGCALCGAPLDPSRGRARPAAPDLPVVSPWRVLRRLAPGVRVRRPG